MELIWTQGRATAEDVREGLAERWPMKDSTARTVLRRLEEKGFLTHTVDGRTYVYEGAEPADKVAVRAVRQILDRFCQGSVESLLVGMVENEVVEEDELERLAKKIRSAKRKKKTRRKQP
jgi:BlaI family transcriptional regulator, penicillinase repressor